MTKKIFISLSICLVSLAGTTQEIGANFNHDPEIIDLEYLRKTPVEWIRTTPYIFEYINGEKSPETGEGLAKIIEAKKAGYKVAFGFRWDFRNLNLRIPDSASARESEYFSIVRRILTRVGSSLDLLTLGNEPNLETMAEDLQPGPDGQVPLVRFTRRLLNEVYLPYLASQNRTGQVPIYAGSLPALLKKSSRKLPG